MPRNPRNNPSHANDTQPSFLLLVRRRHLLRDDHVASHRWRKDLVWRGSPFESVLWTQVLVRVQDHARGIDDCVEVFRLFPSADASVVSLCSSMERSWGSSRKINKEMKICMYVV